MIKTGYRVAGAWRLPLLAGRSVDLLPSSCRGIVSTARTPPLNRAANRGSKWLDSALFGQQYLRTSAKPVPRTYSASAVSLGSSTTTNQVDSSRAEANDLEATSVSQPAMGLGGKPLKIGITTQAVEKLHSLMGTENKPDLALKIHVESGGCHGFQYIFDLQPSSSATAKESIFERDGARVIIDHSSLQILRDSRVDYATELIGSQFKVVSPHTSSSCGCGSSFSIVPESLEE